MVCRKPYDQVLEEVTVDYLLRTAEAGETVEDRQLKRQSFLACAQCAAVTCIPRRLTSAGACDEKKNILNDGNTNQET